MGEDFMFSATMKVRPFALCFLLVVTGLASAMGQGFQGVLTQHNDVGRTGQNLNETTLTPQNVSSGGFGKLFSYTVDGQIYAQPLYVPNVSIPGQGIHNVIYVATELDSVFAFDADGLTGTPLWQDSFIAMSQGIAPVPCWGSECGVYPYYGVTSTPVIDPSTNTMYLVSRSYQASTGLGFSYLHALDITTGAEKFGGPVPLQGSVLGTGQGSVNGMIAYDPLRGTQRVSLLLLNGAIYIGCAGFGHGWIMAYNAQSLAQIAIFNTTPNSRRGGVWQSGDGLAADSSGYIYAVTGDGPFDLDIGGVDYGDTVLKLDANLNVVDYFTPRDQDCRWRNDLDLGSSGPMLLPAQPGNYANELIVSGKGGSPCDPLGTPIFLLNQDNLGKYGSGNNWIQRITGAPYGYWGGPAYWQGTAGTSVYSAGTTQDAGHGDYLKMYSLSNGLLSQMQVSQSPNIFPIGAQPSISSNGEGSGIVWAIERQEAFAVHPGQLPAILYAYDANNVSTMLYDSSQNAQRDQGGCAAKFQSPTIANGRVYIGTQNEIDVFGLLNPAASAPAIYLSNPCYVFPDQPVETSGIFYLGLTNSGNATLSVSGISIVGMNAADFSQTNNCPAELAPGNYCTLNVTFTPSVLGPRIAQVLITDNAAGSPHNAYLTGSGVLSSSF
jgi:hypothetical protein